MSPPPPRAADGRGGKYYFTRGRCSSLREVGEHGVGEQRPDLGGPWPESAVGQRHASHARGRVDPQECPRLSEVAEGARRAVHSCPMWTLVVADLESESPVVGLLVAESRQHT